MIKASSATYHGVKYKSKCEVKMAIFFDLLGFDWEYKPQNFPLLEDIIFIPDFVIHDVHGRLQSQDLYVECKGGGLSYRDWQKMILFGRFKKKVPQRPFLLMTDIFWNGFFDPPTRYYTKMLKERRPKTTYGSWFASLLTITGESSDLAVLCKDNVGRAAVMSRNEFVIAGDVESTANAFYQTQTAYFESKYHEFRGFREDRLPIEFNKEDIPNWE